MNPADQRPSVRDHADALKLLVHCTTAIDVAARVAQRAESARDLATVADVIADVRELSAQIIKTADVIARAVAADEARHG